MGDKTYNLLIPATKAIDNGDGTFSLAVDVASVAPGVNDSTLKDMLPSIKVISLSDGTFALCTSVE